MSNHFFKSRARLLQQLGDQLIRNESVAIMELVKNAYDADASCVDIQMIDIEKSTGKIIIEDDGSGMDQKIIKNAWLEIGSDFKEKDLLRGKVTPKFGRLPIGEKGVGRFGVHKLGNKIELISKKKSEKEIVLNIDWEKIDESKYLEDFPIEIREREPKEFLGNKTGTKIVISNLKSKWEEKSLKEVFRAVNSLSSPFKTLDSFKVTFSVEIDGIVPDWLSNESPWNKMRNYALYQVECEIEGDSIRKFNYEFLPWSTMPKLKTRKVTEKDAAMSKVLRMVDRKNNPIDLSPYAIGKIKFRALIFSLDPKILKLGLQDPATLKEYLKNNGGIRVFRDGMRVYDYGEPGNDWLDLDIGRVNRPGIKISNNIVIGAVSLSRKNSADLIEKSNREGFVENNAYKKFVCAIQYVIGKVEAFRKIDKDILGTYYGPTPTSEPVVSDIAELRDFIDENISEEKTKKEIHKYLKRIEGNYREINEVLLGSAGAGLSMSIVIHEIEKIIKALKITVKEENSSKNVVSLVKNLANLIEGYTLVISRTSKKEEDLKKIIENSLAISEFRFKAHNIEFVKDYENYKGEGRAICAKNLIISSITNIFDNAIWWLDYAKPKKKKIFVGLSENIKGYLSLIIADNGLGFALPTEEIIKPFVSAKEGGMGLGLHIASEIMNSHEGLIIFPEKNEVDVPSEFKKGAIVVLAFKK